MTADLSVSRRVRDTPMSVKQIARTVVDGRKVTFHIFDGEPITGYVAGMDDYNWLVVTPAGDKHLVHKGSCPRTDLHDEPTYRAEPNHEEIERVVGPFRRYCSSQFFGRDEMPSDPQQPSDNGRRRRPSQGR